MVDVRELSDEDLPVRDRACDCGCHLGLPEAEKSFI